MPQEEFNYIQKIGRRRYQVFYGLEEDGYSKLSAIVEYKPTLEEIKEMVLDAINKEIDRTILTGFVWTDGDGHEYPVWLSTENQFNYKSAFDLAVQTGGAMLPVTFKFGTVENPVYHEFATLEELQDFYLKAIAFIQATYQRGWVEKDSIDWSDYEQVIEL
jgi:hypothetical protein